MLYKHNEASEYYCPCIGGYVGGIQIIYYLIWLEQKTATQKGYIKPYRVPGALLVTWVSFDPSIET